MKRFVFVLVALALCLPAVSAQAEVKSKYNVDFYGYVKLDAFYEDAYAIMDNFALYAPPGNTCGLYGSCNSHEMENDERDSFGMTARQSRFGFLITGGGEGLTTRGRIEVDFYGTGVTRSASANQDVEENKGLLMLRRATVEIIGDNWEILAGNEWMVVSPIFPMTNNYPYGADVGNLGYRTPQIRFTGYMLDKKLTFQVAATNKMGDVEALDIDTGRMSGVPTWEAGVIYKDAFTLGLTGHYGIEEVRTTRHGAFGEYGSEVESWSGNVHVIVPIGDMVSVSGEYYQGANLDGWYTGGQGNGWVVTEDGDREALESTGGWVQLKVSPMKELAIYAAYGLDDVNDDQLKDGVVEPGYANAVGNTRITKNSFYSAMVDYSINPATKVSLEWMQITTEFDLADRAGSDWDDGVLNRYTLSFWYMF